MENKNARGMENEIKYVKSNNCFRGRTTPSAAQIGYPRDVAVCCSQPLSQLAPEYDVLTPFSPIDLEQEEIQPQDSLIRACSAHACFDFESVVWWMSVDERSRLCGMIVLLARNLALLGPWEVEDWDDEEAVRGVGNTCEGVVPGQESRENTEGATSPAKTNVRRTILENEIVKSKHEEGQIQCKEQEEEGHSRLERADEEEEGEDEPALWTG